MVTCAIWIVVLAKNSPGLYGWKILVLEHLNKVHAIPFVAFTLNNLCPAKNFDQRDDFFKN